MHVINRIKFYLKRGKIAFLGKNAIFSGDLHIKGGKYIRIGDSSQIGPECKIEAWDSYNNKRFKPLIELGRDVRINSRCHIGSINKVKIGDNTLIGSNVMIIDHSHGKNEYAEMSLHPSNRDLYSKGPITIGKNCWLCENVVILPNVTIGKCSVIGASAVVTKDIPPYSVAVGNPARVVKRVTRDES